MRTPTTAFPESISYATPPGSNTLEHALADLTTLAELVDEVCDLADEVLLLLQTREADQVRWAQLEAAYLLGSSLNELVAMAESKSSDGWTRAPLSSPH